MKKMWVGYNVGCTMGFLLGHSAWQIDQFPTCWPMNGLSVHWSRGWGVSSFSECLVVSGLNQCRTWNCFACYGIFSEVGTAILAGSVLQNLYYLSPSGAIVTSQWGHLVACGAGIALDREYQCRSLYGLENWAFITNACTNAKDFTCSKLNWNDVPRFMLPAVFY